MPATGFCRPVGLQFEDHKHIYLVEFRCDFEWEAIRTLLYEAIGDEIVTWVYDFDEFISDSTFI